MSVLKISVPITIDFPDALSQLLPPHDQIIEVLGPLFDIVAIAYFRGGFSTVFDMEESVNPPTPDAPIASMLQYAAKLLGQEDSRRAKP